MARNQPLSLRAWTLHIPVTLMVIDFLYRWEATNVSLSFVSAICTLVETGKYTGEALTPWTMLFTHIIKLACASAILALDVVIYTQGFDTNYSAVSIGLDVTLMLAIFHTTKD